jgi:hypothetical protein
MRENRYFILILLILVISPFSFKQTLASIPTESINPEYKADTSKKISYRFSSSIYVDANSLSNQFLYKYAFENYLDKDLLRRNHDLLKSKNRLGFRINNEISAQTLNNTFNNFDLSLQLSQSYIQGSEFTDHIYTLIFIGNEPLRGKSMNIAPVSTDRFSHYDLFMQLHAGFELGEHQFKYGAGIGYTAGNQFMLMKSDRIYFEQAEDGSSMHIDFELSEKRSDVAYEARRIYAINGHGFNGGFYLTYYKADNSRILRLSANQIGMTFWNDKSRSYHIEDEISYQYGENSGGELYQLIEFSTTPDSLIDRYKSERKNKPITTLNPFILSLKYYQRLNERQSIETGLTYHHISAFLPLGYARFNQKVGSSNTTLYLTTIAGGFGGFDFGFGVNTGISENLYLNGGFNHSLALIMPEKRAGFSAYLSLMRPFN